MQFLLCSCQFRRVAKGVEVDVVIKWEPLKIFNPALHLRFKNDKQKKKQNQESESKSQSKDRKKWLRGKVKKGCG